MTFVQDLVQWVPVTRTEEDVRGLGWMRERKCGKEPTWFHVHVLSLLSKSSLSEEEPSKSMSPSPRPSAFLGQVHCGAHGVGRSWIGKMHCGDWDAVGVVVLAPMRMRRRALKRRLEVSPRDR